MRQTQSTGSFCDSIHKAAPTTVSLKSEFHPGNQPVFAEIRRDPWTEASFWPSDRKQRSKFRWGTTMLIVILSSDLHVNMILWLIYTTSKSFHWFITVYFTDFQSCQVQKHATTVMPGIDSLTCKRASILGLNFLRRKTLLFDVFCSEFLTLLLLFRGISGWWYSHTGCDFPEYVAVFIAASFHE